MPLIKRERIFKPRRRQHHPIPVVVKAPPPIQIADGDVGDYLPGEIVWKFLSPGVGMPQLIAYAESAVGIPHLDLYINGAQVQIEIPPEDPEDPPTYEPWQLDVEAGVQLTKSFSRNLTCGDRVYVQLHGGTVNGLWLAASTEIRSCPS